MKKNFFLGIGIFSIAAIFLVGCSGLEEALKKAMRIQPDYYKGVTAGGVLEQRYINYGDSKISSYEFSESGHNYKIWYPVEIKNAKSTFPAVVMSNGSGVRFPDYEATFQHLASWGFVVIGDDEDSTATGQTVSMMVDKLQNLNSQPGIFQNKINLKEIGVSGHSQGAVGAVNAITRTNNGRYFSSAYLASMTAPKVIEDLKWDSWRYDTSKIKIPVFIVAGTGSSDSQSISPLDAMMGTFNSLSGNGVTVLARRKNTEHGQMLVNADGYMTAWFRYTLLKDPRAASVFSGSKPELRSNTSNWQDVHIK